MSWGFERGRIYNRRADIHGRFNGQQRGGIVTPAEHGVIIIFTGEEGEVHGYSDRWRDDGVFEYFGEGQLGDMVMQKGNRAIAEHAAQGKSILLFKILPKGVEFEDEMICEGYQTRRAPDRAGNMRDAFVFELRPIDNVTTVVDGIPPTTDNLEELRKRAFAAAVATPAKYTSTASVFERSRDVRDYVVARAKGDCEGCQQPAPFLRVNGIPYLEPHHIRRLSDGGPDDPRFVIALCPNCHRRVHSGADGKGYNARLLSTMKAIEVS
ncbi:HNH endonuclease [Sinorhizobium sp. A49]|uniref:HNH endonuclease n=1 Tax=Sinorhizobium sp. A49 TaxID=1945861 RepID=UPI0009852BC0|nr:HNH endonuclease signature motif containing protein [Sinorhizobium sp. A49]OOG75568.1 HNH endonuclease [Sinorhizobium sp. A49]